MVTTRRRYGKRTQLKVVGAAIATSVAEVSRATGIPETNIRRWKDDPEMAEYGTKTREEIAEEARALSVKVLAEIRARLPEFDPKDLSVLWGILTDKAQLLSGEATSRTETRELTEALGDHERQALADAIDAWLQETADAPST